MTQTYWSREYGFGKQFDHDWGATGMLLVALQKGPMKVQQQASDYEAGSRQSFSSEFSWALTLNFCLENLPSKFLLCANCPVRGILLQCSERLRKLVYLKRNKRNVSWKMTLYAVQNATVEEFILKSYHIKLCQQNDIHMWNMCV